MREETPERWRRVKEALDAALEAAPGERTAILERRLGDDPAMRSEAEDYLRLSNELGTFIERPAASLS